MFATVPLDRRRFLVILGSAAAYAALRPHAAWARRAADALPALQPWSLAESAPSGTLELARGLVGAAILAPSHWNAQPWRFEVDTSSLRLVLDSHRVLAVSDPDQRFAQMSLGAALENLLVAARAWGLQPTVQYLPHGLPTRPGAPLVAAQVAWLPGGPRRDRVLFAAIPNRRTNPRRFDRRAITLQSRTQLAAQLPEDVRVHWIEDQSAITRLADLIESATLARATDPRARAERFAWLRLDDDRQRRTGDGLTPEALGVGGPAKWLSRYYFHPQSRFSRLGAESLAKQGHDAVKSSGTLALLTVPKRGDASWLVAGQAYARFALMAQALGIALQPFSAPIEAERHRAQVLGAFGASGEEPLLVVRLGHADAPPATPRRAVALVSTYRNS